MAAFLSAAWFDELSARAASLRTDDALRLSLHQVVDGERWTVLVADGRVRVERGQNEADVTLTTDRDTAEAMTAGSLTAQDAMAAGRLRLGGDLSKLLLAAPVLSALAGR